MRAPQVPSNERERLQRLYQTGLLDSLPDERFDRITRMAKRYWDVPIVLISLVDANRQWFKSCIGLDASETSRDISFCGHAIHQQDLFCVEDTHRDPDFSDNPLVIGPPYIRFYAGAPISGGDDCYLGTLCLISPTPRTFSADDTQMLKDLGSLVESEIERIQLSRDQVTLKAYVENERRLREIIDNTRIATWEWNVQTGETTFNERWAEIIGYTLAELEPVSIDTWMSFAHPDDLPQSAAQLDQHFRGEVDYYDVECRMRHKDGYWVWVHDRGRLISRTAEGEPLLMSGTHLDVTERHHAQDELARQIEVLSALNQIASSSDLDLQHQLERALQIGSTFLALPLGIISHIEGKQYTVEWFTAPPEAELERLQIFDLNITYCDLVVSQADVIAIEQMSVSEYSGHPCYQTFSLEAYIGVAIQVNQKPYGTLNFSSPLRRDQPFSEGDRVFMRLLARWIGAAIERELSDQRLTKLVAQVPGMVFQFRRCSDGRVSFPYSSPGIRAIYGVSPEAVKADASAAFAVIHPEDLQAVASSIEQSMQEMSVWQLQYRVKADWGWRWVEGRSTPESQTDGSMVWYGYIHDIDEYKQAELALKENEQRFRGLFELSPIGIALNDFETGRFLEVNEALLQPSGYTREEFFSLSYLELTPVKYMPQEERALIDLETLGRYGPFEKEYIRKDGTRYPVLLRGILLMDRSGRRLIWSFVEDISERKRIEQMKDEFISTVSHELRTPLTSLSGGIGLVAGGALGPVTKDVHDVLAIAQSNSQRLITLINDLLDMDKLVSGKMQLDFSVLNIAEVVKGSIEEHQPYAAQYDVSLRLDSECQEVNVLADKQRLGQVLANLISNAIKFSPSGECITLTVKECDSGVRIEVSDRGPGISPDFAEKIFQKFSQADSTDRRRHGGTGLGLAISKELMEKMGGQIGYSNREEGGAVFYIELPGTRP